MSRKAKSITSFTVKPRKGNENLIVKIKEIADGKKRSLNEYVERLIEVHVENPVEIFE